MRIKFAINRAIVDHKDPGKVFLALKIDWLSSIELDFTAKTATNRDGVMADNFDKIYEGFLDDWFYDIGHGKGHGEGSIDHMAHEKIAEVDLVYKNKLLESYPVETDHDIEYVDDSEMYGEEGYDDCYLDENGYEYCIDEEGYAYYLDDEGYEYFYDEEHDEYYYPEYEDDEYEGEEYDLMEGDEGLYQDQGKEYDTVDYQKERKKD